MGPVQPDCCFYGKRRLERLHRDIRGHLMDSHVKANKAGLTEEVTPVSTLPWDPAHRMVGNSMAASEAHHLRRSVGMSWQADTGQVVTQGQPSWDLSLNLLLHPLQSMALMG